jgi:hypothetical protein
MKALSLVVLLSSFSAMASNLVVKGEIDLSQCQNVFQTTMTGIDQKIQVQFVVSDVLEGTSRVMKVEDFDMDDESDRYPSTYSCLHFTDYPQSRFSLKIDQGVKSLINIKKNIELTSIDKIVSINSNLSCDKNDVATHTRSTMQMVSSLGGQYYVIPEINSRKFGLLINLAPTLVGTRVKMENHSVFNFSQTKTPVQITWTLGKPSMNNSDDMMFIECISTLHSFVK